MRWAFSQLLPEISSFMMGLKLICFDLDGTLLHGRNLAQTIVTTCERVAYDFPQYDAQKLLEANRAIWPDFWAETAEAWTMGQMTGREHSLLAWRRTFAEYGGDVFDDVVAFASAVQLAEYHATHQLYGDVMPTLYRLREHGLKLALVTNGARDTQRGKIKALDLDQWFDVMALSGELGMAKPNPQIFEFVLTRLQIAPHEAVHVGDNLKTDVKGALVSGLQAVWLNRKRRPNNLRGVHPDEAITGLGELLRLLCL